MSNPIDRSGSTNQSGSQVISFEQLLESIRDAFFAVDYAWRITYANQKALADFAAPASDLLGRVLWDAIPTLRDSDFQAECERAVQEGRTAAFGCHFWGQWLDVRVYPSAWGLSVIVRNITDRERGRDISRESENEYRTLFDSIDQGFCIIEMLFDEAGRPIDYRFLEMNPAFERHSGLQNAAGRTMRELAPAHEPHWFEIYGRVAITGMPERFINEAKHLDGRWFDVFAFRLGGPGSSKVAVLFNDITEQRSAAAERERLLREIAAERKRLMDIFQQAPSIMCVLSGPDHVIRLANDRYHELVGHRDILGKQVRDALPEVEGQGFFEMLDSVYRTGETYVGSNVRLLLQRESDQSPEERFLDFVYQAVRDPEGTITGVFAQGVDLTDRKFAEDRLRVSEERFRRAFEIETVGVIFFDSAGRITQANDAFLKMGGYDADDLAAGRLRWDELTPAEWRDASRRAIQELKTTGRTTPYEKEYYRKDGTRRLALFAARRITETESVEFVIDVSARRLAEEELREKTGRLNLLLENIRDYAVVISDASGTIIEWQGGAERITGFRADEAIGRKLSIIFTAEDRAAGRPESELIKAATVGRADDKRWHARKDGSRFYADGVTIALRDDAGQLRGFGKIFRDATAEKRSEEALEEASRRKDEFLATLAHELRNPLAPISNALQILPLVEEDRAETRRLQQLMERQVEHMTRLVDDLLDVARISRGKIVLQKQRLDLAATIESALEAVRPFVESRQHELIVELPSEPVALEGDPNRLVQVIGNLVHNAAKYTGQSGHIWVTARREGNLAVIRVRDNGPGIPPEKLEGIFEMFTQIDQTLDRAHGGLDIGLTLVKSLVDLHGGTISAASEGSGHGSEFVVSLPTAVASTAPPGTRQGLQSDRSVPPPSRRVLIVDDMRPSADTLAMMLKGLNQQTRTAYDGPSALEIAKEFHPEVAILDVAMPGMDGYEVVTRMRQLLGKEAFLIALTGYGQEEDRRRTSEAGFDHHLVKPTSVDALHQLLSGLP